MPIDYKKYPPNWKTEIVPRILERAGNCCEVCRLKNGQNVFSIRLNVRGEDGKYRLRTIWFRDMDDAARTAGFIGVRIVKVVLTIAHLDHDERNWNVPLDRLKALCQLCHLSYDAKEKYRRVMEKSIQGKLINQTI